jgi:hypothetical protein
MDKETHMIRRTRALRALAVAATAMSPFAAQAQDFGVRSMKPQVPVENRPKVDEKAYKAALDRIPAPTEKYDPWGSARSSTPAKPRKNPN